MDASTDLDPLSVTVLGRGHLDSTALAGDEIIISGWMFLPDREFDRLRLYFDGCLIDLANQMSVHHGLATTFPWIEHAPRSGFRFHLDKSDVGGALPHSGRIDLLGWCDGEPVARMSSLFRADLNEAVPTPPPELMVRVVGAADDSAFKLGGLKGFSEFTEAVTRHRPLSSFRRMLDWGCGCGRITVHFLALPEGPEVLGCDIDGEATAWCNEHLGEGAFAQVAPFPPTHYDERSFDLVISYSVFTHLTRAVQRMWLEEMHRLIAPGGLFLASTHGESSAYSRSREFLPRVLKEGIVDQIEDPALSGIAPEGYYRGTFQSQEYTLRTFGEVFDVLAYIERGIGNSQDLVVMRRP